MKVCYNTYCPFSPDKPHECDCAEMCERFTDGPVTVTTSNRTESLDQMDSRTTNNTKTVDKNSCEA